MASIHTHARAEAPPSLHLADEADILAWLALPAAQHAPDDLGAHIVAHGAAPPQARDRGGVLHWLWSLLGGGTGWSAANRGFLDVLAWIVATVSSHATLARVVPQLLRDAVVSNQCHAMEFLLESSAFVALLTAPERQQALDAALHCARDARLCDMLVAYGARVEVPRQQSSTPIVWMLSSGAIPIGETDELLLCEAFRRWERNAVLEIFRHDRAIVAGAVSLEWAIANKCVNALTFLVDEGFVDVDARRNRQKYTPLMRCLAARPHRAIHDKMARVLVKANADMAYRDRQGNTALSLAVQRSDLNMVELLLDRLVARYGRGGVHKEKRALEIAFQLCRVVVCPAFHDVAARVLTAMLNHGACVTACFDMMINCPDDSTSAFSVELVLGMTRACETCEMQSPNAEPAIQATQCNRKRKRDGH